MTVRSNGRWLPIFTQAAAVSLPLLLIWVAAVADEVGLERLTLASIAQRLGLTQPSLYKHVGGLDALKRDLAVLGVRELTAALSAPRSAGPRPTRCTRSPTHTGTTPSSTLVGRRPRCGR